MFNNRINAIILKKCLDINEGGILNLLQNNIDRNKVLVKNPISVLELNFFKNDFNPELLKLLTNVKIILAADGNYMTCPNLDHPLYIFFL